MFFTKIKISELITPLCLLFVVYSCIKILAFQDPVVLHDLRATYFPSAEAFWQKGIHFLKTEESIRVSFLSYAIPAIMKQNPQVMQFSYLILIFVAFWSVWWMGHHSNKEYGGAIASATFVLVPGFLSSFNSIGLEPLVITLELLVMRSGYGLCKYKDKRYTIQLSIFTILLLLLRAVDWYFVIVLFFGSIFFLAYLKTKDRKIFKHFLIFSSLYLAIGSVIILKNKQLFDHSGITTGGAAALYLGAHPFSGGIEPHYVGVTFGFGPLISGGSHLSVESEKRLIETSKAIIEARGIQENLLYYIRKLKMVIFQPNYGSETEKYRPYWRAVSLVMLIFLFVSRVKYIWSWLLLGWAGYRVAILTAVLYTERYTYSLLDPILLVVNIIVLSLLAKFKTSTKVMLLCFVLVTLSITFYEKHTFRMALPSSNHTSIVKVESKSAKEQVQSTKNISRTGQKKWRIDKENAELSFLLPDINQPDNNALATIEFDLVSGKCNNSNVKLVKYNDVLRERKFTPSVVDKIRIGWITQETLSEGLEILIEFNCTPNTEVEFGELSVYFDHVGIHYAEKLFGWKP